MYGYMLPFILLVDADQPLCQRGLDSNLRLDFTCNGRQKLVRSSGALAFDDSHIPVHFRLADPVHFSTRARPGEFDPVNLILARTQDFARVMT